jgi:homoserine dehydrogenase
MATGRPGSGLRRVPVCLLGPGGVGRAFLQLVIASRARLAARYALHLAVVALADSRGLVAATGDEIDDATLGASVELKRQGTSLADWRSSTAAAGAACVDGLDPAAFGRAGETPILVDTSAADTTASLLDARAGGWQLVLANKIPLTGAYDVWQRLTTHGRGARWEATVASALPVIATLQTLLDQADTVHWISGTVSGTLGAVTARLAEGSPLSEVVSTAVADGLAEADPRTDLSGLDVARKALILARMLDQAIDLADVAVESLYPTAWNTLDADAFRARLPEADAPLAERFASARSMGTTLRYVATVGHGPPNARLVALEPTSVLARADASDSIVVFETDRYRTRPLVISGRGGGPGATAAAVLGDVVSLARE